MNYFELYPGDYQRDTAALTLAQHGAFLLLLATYYSTEKPIPSDNPTLFRIARAMTSDEQSAVLTVADLFFPVSSEDGMRHNERADAEIVKARARIESARTNGKRGGNPLKKAGYNEPGYMYAIQRASGGPIKVGITKYVAQRYSTLRGKVGPIREIALVAVTDMGATEAAMHNAFKGRLDGEWIDATEEELMRVWLAITQPSGVRTTQPSNQTPQTPDPIHKQEARADARSTKSRGTRLPADWEPDSELTAWAMAERPGLSLTAELAKFRDYWAAKAGAGGVKLDWSATYRNWIRNSNSPGVTHAASQPNRKLSAVEQVEQAIREQFASGQLDDEDAALAQIGYG